MLKFFKDQEFRNFPKLTEMVLAEHIHQIAKWGVQVHTSFEWLTYTAEELGSVAKAIGEYEHRGGSPKKVVNEAIQVATLALKIAEMFTTGEEETA